MIPTIIILFGALCFLCGFMFAKLQGDVKDDQKIIEQERVDTVRAMALSVRGSKRDGLSRQNGSSVFDAPKRMNFNGSRVGE